MKFSQVKRILEGVKNGSNSIQYGTCKIMEIFDSTWIYSGDDSSFEEFKASQDQLDELKQAFVVAVKDNNRLLVMIEKLQKQHAELSGKVDFHVLNNTIHRYD